MTNSTSDNINSSTESDIALTELADELQCHKMTLFKIAKRLDVHPTKRRDPDRRNQVVSFVNMSDAGRIRDEYLANRRNNGTNSTDAELLLGDTGVFYVVQLEPEHDPGRIKVGFTTDLEGRLRKHRCSAPFAESLKSWPCRRTWERAALDCVTEGLEQLHTEVFRTTSIDEAITRGENFFSIMPTLQMVPDDDPEED